MLGLAPLARAVLADHGQFLRLGMGSSQFSLSGSAAGASGGNAGVTGNIAIHGASFATGAATLRTDGVLALSGKASATAAAQAGTYGDLALAGHGSGAVLGQTAADPEILLQTAADGEAKAQAGITGQLILSRQVGGETHVQGDGTRSLSLFGDSAGLSGVRTASEGVLGLVAIGQADATIQASGLDATGVTGAGTSATGLVSRMGSEVAVHGSGFGVSLSPLSVNVTDLFDFEGLAAAEVSVRGDGTHPAALSGKSQMQAAVAGSSAAHVDMALVSAAPLSMPVTARSAVLLSGSARAVAQAVGFASADMSLPGSSRSLLRLEASAARALRLRGIAATDSGITGAALGSFGVSCTLSAGTEIAADAIRAISPQGQSVGQTATYGAVADAVTAFGGVAKAASANSADLASSLEVSGGSEADLSIVSDLIHALQVALSASASAPLQAASQSKIGANGKANIAISIASTALGPITIASKASCEVLPRAEIRALIAFERSTEAAAQIDATSARMIVVALNALAAGALSARAVGTVFLGGHALAALPAHAEAAFLVDLDGNAKAENRSDAACLSRLNLAAVSRADASVGAAGFTAFDVAAAGEASARVFGESLNRLPMVGDSATIAPLSAYVENGAFEFELTSRAEAASRSLATGRMALTGVGRCRVASNSHAAGAFGIMRAGVGDVFVAAQSARVITLLGQSHVAIVSAAAARTPIKVVTSLQAQAIISAVFEQEVISASGGSTAISSISGIALPDLWRIVSVSQGFRAPPALRRLARPNEHQGGSLMPSLRSGRILRG